PVRVRVGAGRHRAEPGTAVGAAARGPAVPWRRLGRTGRSFATLWSPSARGLPAAGGTARAAAGEPRHRARSSVRAQTVVAAASAVALRTGAHLDQRVARPGVRRDASRPGADH